MRLGLLLFGLGMGSGGVAEAQEFAQRLHLEQPKGWSATLLGEPDALPMSMQVALTAEVEAEMAQEAEHFAVSLAPMEGGGDRGQVSNDGALAFVVGTFLGFGLGHFLIAHEPERGLLWLAVDFGILVGMIVFFAVVWPVGVVFLLAFLVERVFQGLDAWAGTHSGGLRFGGAAESDEAGRVAERPRSFFPNIVSLAF